MIQSLRPMTFADQLEPDGSQCVTFACRLLAFRTFVAWSPVVDP